ncbi:MAG: type II secretion system F family protein [Pirellulales bacterium]
MPDFAYVARDGKGQRVTGTINAQHERDVLAMLSSRALFPLHVDTGAVKTAKKNAGRRVKPILMATFYSQLSGLLRSGVPLLRSLEVLKRQSANPALNEVLTQVHALVEGGTGLGEAMSRFPNTFSEMGVNMVRAGMEGGFLEDGLARVSQFTEQQADLKSKTFGAMVYPIALTTIGSLVVAALMIFVVPNFKDLFATLREKGQLPVVTEWLLMFSDLMTKYWIAPLGLGIGLYYWISKYLATENGRMFRDRWSLKIPGAGKIILNLSVARFCRVLGTLLQNGVPILKSLDISADAAGNRILGKAIHEATSNISAGQSLAKPLADSGHFPVTITEMISVAKEANTLDSVLVEIADGLEKQTWRQLDLFIKLLEPLMLLLLAGVILVVVIALLLPVMRMSTAV